MKRFLLLLIVAVLSIGTAVAQPNNSDKSLWKSAKKAAKELKKEGWKTDGVEPMENLIYQHLKNYKAPGYREVRGIVEGGVNATTINQAKQWSYNIAAVTYAKEAGLALEGIVTLEAGSGLLGQNLAADNFYEAYKGKVAKEIKGELTFDFGVYKKKKDGTIEYRGYYLLKEDAATSARERALDAVINESEAARNNAEKISEFVRRGFEPTE